MPDLCIPLTGTTTCPAWSSASISTSDSVVKQFRFLEYVSNLKEFDQQLSQYMTGQWVKDKYQNEMKCPNVNLTNPNEYYSRYATSVICNGIVQSSKTPCQLSDNQTMPLCAESCAAYATSEEEIVVNSKACGASQAQFIPQIRSDFAICSQPSNSLSGSCISGSVNEPDNCGYAQNLQGLCGYCASSSPNSTDSCCVNSQASTHCSNVHLPTTTSMPPLFPSSTSTSQPTATNTSATSSNQGQHLTGGDIAGIVIGSVVGLALIIALIALLVICVRRRRRRDNGNNVLNQPSPHRKGPPQMEYASTGSPRAYAAAVPAGRVARMSALQGESVDSSPRTNTATTRGGAAKYSDTSDSEGFGATPEGRRRGPPMAGRRHGSLSSTSALGIESENSPQSRSGGQVSSPEGVTSGRSEQLPYFRDYYSQDDIHPNDKVAVLWAYQPRAGDEFDLERGDVLKVVGIWDDGWATGVRLDERAEDLDLHNQQRDSGVSNGSEKRSPSPVLNGEIKAFPLVCVCLPQHWRKIIDGETAGEASSPP